MGLKYIYKGFTMKRLFLILCLMFFSLLPVFAEYKPIPKELSKQYRAEITQIIDTQCPLAASQVEGIAAEAHSLYNSVLKNPKLYEVYYESNFDIHIDNPMFNLYKDILLKTEYYAKLSDSDIPATGYSGTLYEFLEPYFKDNHIDTKKLFSLGSLAALKQEQIEKEQNHLYQLYDH